MKRAKRKFAKKDTYGRTYTKFGYCLHIVLTVIGFISFFLMIGLTGSCERFQMTVHEYIVQMVPCIAVFCGCVIIHEKIFGGDVE